MTQLDLPQVSFARYLDLLKRHRWQVLPVSLLGLLVGGVVAFMIPRYYVAETVVEFQGAVLGTEEGVDDPMAGLVDSAEVTIPYSVGAVLDKLQWPESLVDDESDRQAFEASLRGRIEIVDLNPRRRRSTAQLRVTYRDTNGLRAREFTNQLVEIWRRERLLEMTGRADGELSRLNQQIEVAVRARGEAEREIAMFQRRWQINPQDAADPERGFISPATAKQLELESKVAELEEEIAGLEIELEAARAKRAQTSPTVAVDPDDVAIPKELQLTVLQLTTAIQTYDAQLGALNESNPTYALRQIARDAAAAQLEELRKSFATEAGDEKENPDYREVDDQVRELETRLAARQAALKREQPRLTEQQARLADLSGLMQDYRALVDRRDKAERELEALEGVRFGKREERDLLDRGDAYRVLQSASLPKRPTEPNITLVALAGSAVGLAFAIGLILLIDVLQSTFKTVDDVERLLSLPVLGGLSYMTTDEEVRAQSARRNRIGLIVGVLLLLMITLVTVYYVDPTRLPESVRDGLDLLLGAPTEPASGG